MGQQAIKIIGRVGWYYSCIMSATTTERISRKSTKFARKTDNPQLDASTVSQGTEAQDRPVRKKKTGHLSAIYIELFGKQPLKEYVRELKSREYESEEAQREFIEQRLRQRIVGDIVRLRAIEDDSKEMGRVLERANGRATEEKWKLVVLSYRDRLRKAEEAVFQQRRLREKAEEWIESEQEQAQRLAHMNNLKFNKIDSLVADIADRDEEIAELSQTVSEMTVSCSSLKEEISRNSELLNRTLHEKEQLESSLAEEREKSFLLEAQTHRQTQQRGTSVLSRDEQEVNKQISDLKQKYEGEIARLETRLETQQVQIEALREQLQLTNNVGSNIQPQTEDQAVQTGQSVVHACYYSSLHDQLAGQIPEEDYEQEQQRHSEDQEDEFDLPASSKSVSNHHYTPDRAVVLSDDEDDFITCKQQEEVSFEDQRSVSNAPSHYVETLQELTKELSQAYAKINQLSAQMGELEAEKDRLSRLNRKNSAIEAAAMPKISQTSPVPPTNSISNGKSIGGYLSSFWKK